MDQALVPDRRLARSTTGLTVWIIDVALMWIGSRGFRRTTLALEV